MKKICLVVALLVVPFLVSGCIMTHTAVIKGNTDVYSAMVKDPRMGFSGAKSRADLPLGVSGKKKTTRQRDHTTTGLEAPHRQRTTGPRREKKDHATARPAEHSAEIGAGFLPNPFGSCSLVVL